MINNSVVTKADLQVLKADLQVLRADLQALEQRLMLRLGRWLFAGFGLLISLLVGLFAILL